MSERRADYSEIAEVYDAARGSDLPHIVWWRKKIAAEARLGPGKRLIDLGCGTGRWTIPLAEETGCEAVGLDSSPEMLAKARSKDTGGRVEWVLGDVEHLELPLESFDCAFLCLMMHHVADHLRTFRGVLTILRPGGVILVRQGTLEQIMDDVWHRFFPGALTIDRQRTPFRAEIEQWLGEAGFEDVRAEEVKQMTYESHERLLKEIRLRVGSVLRMISDEAFERGLRRLEEHIAGNPDDPWVRENLFTLFSARRPE